MAHLLAWSIQQALSVDGLSAMPFYYPNVEETLSTALSDLMDQIGVAPAPLPGFELM